LRACWGDERIDISGVRFRADAIAMEPKPPQRERLPIWFGGAGPAAFRRIGQSGDGWMGMVGADNDRVRASIDEIHRQTEAAGRDPAAIGLQAMLAPPPRSAGGKAFYGDHDRVARRAEEIAALGFGWIAVNATAIFQAGARSVDALIEQLSLLHTRLRAAIG
jgi:alkanesulfonate monooxygenase SsuD/methylene tetrahydromethanopterin reductase-like flavin-dependent oxidoreductase (luciferase family)